LPITPLVQPKAQLTPVDALTDLQPIIQVIQNWRMYFPMGVLAAVRERIS
jgi:hypothetical protein